MNSVIDAEKWFIPEGSQEIKITLAEEIFENYLKTKGDLKIRVLR